MSLQEYLMRFPAYPPSIANGNVGPTWPKNPIFVSDALERTAAALWRFKWAPYSLIDIATDPTDPVRPTLVPLTSTSPPGYTPHSLIINPNSGLSGLASSVVETTAQTVFMIVRRDVPSGNRMIGNTQDGNPAGTGWGWFNANTTPNSLSFLSRGLTTRIVDLSSINPRFCILIAVAHTVAGREIYIRNVGSPIVTTGTYRPSTRPINVGNGLSGAFNRSAEIVSVAVYNSAFASSAMATTGERMVQAAAALGVTVY